MFKLFRRISYGVIPRSDRPWEEDPTSNAPQVRRKRRLSSIERDPEEEQAHKKKARGDSATPSVADAEGKFLVPTPQVDTQEVKDVTQGVEEVVLDGKDDGTSADVAAPETIPLPDEKSGELDEPISDATSSSLEAPSTSVEESSKIFSEQPTTTTSDESPGVASLDNWPPETTQNPKALEASPTPHVQTASGSSNDVTTKE
jgi:hypothetical protein